MKQIMEIARIFKDKYGIFPFIKIDDYTSSAIKHTPYKYNNMKQLYKSIR